MGYSGSHGHIPIIIRLSGAQFSSKNISNDIPTTSFSYHIPNNNINDIQTLDIDTNII